MTAIACWNVTIHSTVMHNRILPDKQIYLYLSLHK